jgi:hypothetical protein
MSKIEDYPLLAKELDSINFVVRLRLKNKFLYVSETGLTSEQRRAVVLPCDYKGLSLEKAYKDMSEVVWKWLLEFDPDEFVVEGSLE